MKSCFPVTVCRLLVGLFKSSSQGVVFILSKVDYQVLVRVCDSFLLLLIQRCAALLHVREKKSCFPLEFLGYILSLFLTVELYASLHGLL
jgi:hypothetical protein